MKKAKWFALNFLLLCGIAYILNVEAHYTLANWQMWVSVILGGALNISGFIEGQE